MSVIRSGRRLLRDTSGQYLLFGAVLVIAILAFLLVIPNGTQVTTQKMRAQTAADAGAFTGSVWLARSLNLNANMNIGIRSVYTWMTVLTMGEALAKALYSDSLDPSVRAMGQGITTALFGSSNPVTVGSVEYPGSIQKLDTAAQWLYNLQDDIGANFSSVAATLGGEEASRNSGAYPASQAAGGWAIVRTNDTVPLLVASTTGDSLMYAYLNQFPAALQTIPTLDTNIGPATGQIIISPTTHDVWAYYGDSSQWYDVRQVLHRMYQKCVIQTWHNTSNNAYDTMIEYRQHPGGWQNTYMKGDSLAHWLWQCNEPGHVHTPIVQIGVGKYAPPWQFIEGHPSNNRYKRDTVWTKKHMAKKPYINQWIYNYPNTGPLLDQSKPFVNDSGDVVESSMVVCTGFYTGNESTVGYKGPKVRPRQVNPNRKFHTASYVWRQGGSSSPYGLGAPIGGTLFPRSAVAATSPLFTVARAEPYAGTSSPTAYQNFFTPAWDVRLTPMDSTGVQEICSDTAYGSHTHNSFNNLQDLRKYALLP